MKNTIFKKLISFVVLAILAILPITSVFAENTASLSISSQLQNFQIGQTFDASIFADPANQTYDLVRANVSFPAEFLEIQKFTFGPLFAFPSPDNSFDNTTGLFSYGAGIPGGTQVKAFFGTITFKVKKAGQANVQINSDSLIASDGQNIFNQKTTSIAYNFSEATPIVNQKPSITPVKKVQPSTMQEALLKPEPQEPQELQDQNNLSAALAPAIKIISDQQENSIKFWQTNYFRISLYALLTIIILSLLILYAITIVKKNKTAKIKIHLLLALTIASGIFAFSNTALSASDTALVAQPARFEIEAQPGEKLKRSALIINRSNNIVKLKISIKDFLISGKEGKIELYDSATEKAKDWIIPQFLEISLLPLQTKKIDFIVAVPQDISAGGHYGSIVFEPEGSLNTNNNFGVLVLLTVLKEGTATGASINKISSGIFQDKDPINLSLSVTSLGNTHFTANGNIIFKDLFGRETANFNLGKLIVYPTNTRQFDFEWKNHSGFGIYRAQANLTNTTQKDQTLSASTWFFVSPISLPLLTTIFLLLLILGGAIFTIKKFGTIGIINRYFAIKTTLNNLVRR